MKNLNAKLSLRQRKEIETKMSKALKENIQNLSAEFQKILIDDLVTAFQNRINVLIRATEKGSY